MCGRSKTTIGVSKEGRYIPNSGIIIGTYHIRGWRTRKKGCVCGWNSWVIPYRRHGPGFHYGTASKTGRTNGEDRTKYLPKVFYGWKWIDSTIRKISESNLWVPEECAVILWESGGRYEVKRVPLQPILPMCSQYYGKWKADDQNMARQLIKNIAQWSRWSNKVNRLDKGNLRHSYEWILWEETQLFQDGPWLLSWWRGQGDNDGLTK